MTAWKHPGGVFRYTSCRFVTAGTFTLYNTKLRVSESQSGSRRQGLPSHTRSARGPIPRGGQCVVRDPHAHRILVNLLVHVPRSIPSVAGSSPPSSPSMSSSPPPPHMYSLSPSPAPSSSAWPSPPSLPSASWQVGKSAGWQVGKSASLQVGRSAGQQVAGRQVVRSAGWRRQAARSAGRQVARPGPGPRGHLWPVVTGGTRWSWGRVGMRHPL